MKILAFMQNMWLRDPASFARHVEKAGADGEEFRLRFIEYALFAGCVTGRRLRKAFGAIVCGEIIWEESTREVADNPKTIFPPDPAHITATLKRHAPHVVLTFGRIAGDAVVPLWPAPNILIRCPHPAARQPDVFAKLSAAAEELERLRATL